MGLFWALSIAIAAVSSVLLLGLLSVYVRNHRELRSPFTLGLIFFAVLFLVQNLGSIYFYYLMNEWGEGPGMGIPMFALGAAELVGVAALFYVTWR
ncbi:MAG: hypothetical protein WC985_01185 [Thermoplasmata archaeon]